MPPWRLSVIVEPTACEQILTQLNMDIFNFPPKFRDRDSTKICRTSPQKQLKTSTNKKLEELLPSSGPGASVSFGFFNPTWGARLKSSQRRFVFYMVCFVGPEKWVHNPSKSLPFGKSFTMFPGETFRLGRLGLP